MFLQTLRRGFTARNMRTIRPITVDASALSQTEVPHEQAFTWVQYFSHLGEPSDITVIDGTLLETDELDALARQEEGTNDSRAILAASKRTLTKASGASHWQLGNKSYTLDEVKEFFNGKMKGKHMYVIPYYNDWNNTYGVRISDSAYMTLISLGLQTAIGHKVWADMAKANELEVVIHSTGVSILPDDPLVNISVTPKAKATVDERIAEAKKRYESGKRE